MIKERLTEELVEEKLPEEKLAIENSPKVCAVTESLQGNVVQNKKIYFVFVLVPDGGGGNGRLARKI